MSTLWEQGFDLSRLDLTPDQRRAVGHEGGPLIVLAGPGTGKTRVITARVAQMIAGRGIAPERIVAVTFTNKAAGELGDRLGELVGTTLASRVVASTFHSLGLGIVRRFGDVLGIASEPVLIDSAQRRQLLRELIRAHKLYARAMGSGIETAIDLASGVMDALRNQGMTGADALGWLDAQRSGLGGMETREAEARAARLDRFEQAALAYTHFEAGCLERGWMVFDDLIMLPTRLMREHPSIAAILRHDHRHVVVDEFQDVNAAQLALIEALCPAGSDPDLCVVGDDDQSIYGFRGADDRAFAHFAAIYPGAPTIALSTNFRSAEAIVEAGNAIIEGARSRFDENKHAGSFPGRVEGARVELVRLEDDKQSGEAIAAMLLSMASADERGPGGGGFDFGSCAVIARTGGELERIAQAMAMEGIPVEIRAKASPMDDEGVRDVIAWARLLSDPCSAPDLRRLLVRAPYRCDPIALGRLIASWRTARSRLTEGDGDAPDPGGLIEWIVGRATEPMKGRAGRMAMLARELGAIAGEVRADRALLEIIKRTGVVHGELEDGRRRAARIAALVALVRFARTRLDRFESPGDLSAMLRYYDDLDPKEQSLGELPEDRVTEADDGSGVRTHSGAVAMLTAHASKGLEFDTVFIPRISGPHGYPMTSGMDDEVLPIGVIDRSDDDRDIKSRRIDEERRVFYVALTRARRRAVLLAKVPKKTGSVNFVFELRRALGDRFVERDIGDVLDPGAMSDAVGRLGAEFKAASRIRDVFEQARRDARREAASAIDAMELGEIGRDELGWRLAKAGDRLAAISAVHSTGLVPDWIGDPALLAYARTLVGALDVERVGEDESPHPGLEGPLRLSFTQISGYLRCPRCYLVERVLGLPADEGTAAVVGKAIHEALEKFYQRWRTADSEGAPTPGIDELTALVRKCFFRHWPGDVEVEPGRLAQAEAMGRALWERLHSEEAHIEELEKKLTLPYEHEGVTHSIHAVLDRIDATPSGGRRVIDYKTGYPRKELAEPKADDLQLGIYAMALSHVFGDPGPGSACEYWLLQDGTRGSIAIDEMKMDKVRAKIDKAIAGMLAGDWAQSQRCAGSRGERACSILDEAGASDITQL